ncbi:DUF5724 domain-containing protein [Rhodopirellula sp. MGV]|uniref:DUF5724 domain-containing protein n=1 Tax=Rhodopirellula sp. MGV TaxID=2023130 RepID=UPI000B9723AE|nr:DUF5724 domain-containing protein [Rhodopirellula sp. MGV]OYP37488.1 hypothetical protein CGZ80_04995 [Rhodopirellula sp. MGV]PNY37890.1 hypothetical protein C2E31_05130 [Rhodopirellula baltica]
MALSPEEAQQQATQWILRPSEQDGGGLTFDERVQAELAKRLEQVPARLRKICFGMFGRDAKGQYIHDWDKINEAEEAAHLALEELPDKDIYKLIRATAGNAAPLIETAWQWLETTCESYHYEKKTIRSSSLGPAVQIRRVLWLKAMIELCVSFEDEVLTLPMLAVWAPYLQTGYISREQQLGQVIAANLSDGHEQSEETLEVLRQIVHEEHEIGVLGDHVFYGLWAGNCEEGWELIERLLLTTDESHESLRQAILVAAFDAHPDALARLFGMLHEQGMSRYTAVVHAMDEWLGWHWSLLARQKIVAGLETLARFVGDPEDATEFLTDPGLDADHASDVYLALWAIGVRLVEDALSVAQTLIQHPSAEVRYATVCYLAWLEFAPAIPLLASVVNDEDERVALKALRGIDAFESIDPSELCRHLKFADVVSLFERLPVKTQKFMPIVWPWTETKARRIDITEALFLALGDQPPTALLPHRADLSPEGREKLARLIVQTDDWSEEARTALVEMVGDLSLDVREVATRALRAKGIRREELTQICEFLKRKSADLRNEILKLFLVQDDDTALAIANELCLAKNKQQRLAGLELLRCLAKENRQRSACVTAASQFPEHHKRLSKDEQLQINAILKSYKPKLSPDNGFGLLNPSGRTAVTQPKKNRRQTISAASRKLLHSLDELIDQHRDTPISFLHGAQDVTAPLAQAEEAFVDLCDGKAQAEVRARLPLAELWESWFEKRPKTLIDSDGLEVMRALFLMQSCDDEERDDIMPFLEQSESRLELVKVIGQDTKPPTLRYPELVQAILEYFLLPVAESEVLDYLIDVTENVAASIPQEDFVGFIPRGKNYSNPDDQESADPYEQLRTNEWLWLCKVFLEAKAADPNVTPTPEQWDRIWKLLRWCDEPTPGARRLHCDFSVTARAYLAGAATLDDVIDQLVGPRSDSDSQDDFPSLAKVTQRKQNETLRDFRNRPEIHELLKKIRAQLLEIELQRGESETTATGAIRAIRSFHGSQTLFRILTAIGETPLKRDRGSRSSGHKRAVVLTELAVATYPLVSDLPGTFATHFKQAKSKRQLTEERLIELSSIAPHWADYVDAALETA